MTNTIIGLEHELIWESYVDFANDRNSLSDIVILHLTEMMMRKGLLILLIRIKIKFGRLVPILVVGEGGTPQQVYSVLKSGADDYFDILNGANESYRKKIDDIIMWKWYLKKYNNIES